MSGKEKSIGGEVSRRQTKGNDTDKEATLDSVQDLNFSLGIAEMLLNFQIRVGKQ